MLHTNTVTFSWEVMEFTFKEKRKLWYWVVSIAALILILVSVLLLKNYLFGFFILIAAGLMMKTASKQPISLPVELSDQGIKIYQDLYGYEMLHQFWVKENSDSSHTLLLLSDRRISPIISVEIATEIDPMEVREYLLSFLPEQEMKESVTNRVIDKIGF